jgi:putative membrane-bound dehydrogenase-like protein
MSRYWPRDCALAAWLFALAAQGAHFTFPSQTLTVPDGFEVDQIAGPPLVNRPISGAFDERGRLYLTDSSGSNDKVQKQLEDKPHRVVRLEGIDSGGRFTQSTVFAEHLMFPEGCMWFDGALYVSAPPSIWRLTDTDNDGVADRREEWHQGKTLTGCANDLHGPYLGLDGWIYWCKGAFAKQTYERPGRKPILTRASHIFRSPVDHSDLEFVLTAGMDNPVGVAFTAGGERLMCGTFLLHPAGGKRDGIVHAIYGGVYGKINDVTDDHPKTGDLMPIMTHLGAAAPCSIIRYESDMFGQDYRDNLFVCCFNLHKVTRHLLLPDGSTFKTKDSDFVTSDNADFHPTDIFEDADGSLILIDTGGWYKLCCPTSQLSKPDVLGAVYRIRRSGAPTVEDPRGLKLAWDKMDAGGLTTLLDDRRPSVRKRAIRDLGKLDQTAVPALTNALKEMTSLERRHNAVWALTRINAPSARAAVRSALADRDESVICAAIHSASLWRDTGARELLLDLLQTGNPPLQRAAAEALGRLGDKSAVPALLAVSARPHDRILEHSLIFALIEIADPAATAPGLTANSSLTKRAALIALDQMEGGGLKPETVAPLLGASDILLRETATWIASHHPQWGDALAGFFQERLSAKTFSAAEAEQLETQLALFAVAASIQNLIVSLLDESATPAATRQLLLQAMALTSLKSPPAGWVRAVNACLAQQPEEVLLSAVATARVLGQAKANAPNFSEPLLALARDETRSAGLRLEALAALPAGVALEPRLLAFLRANLDSAGPVMMRGAAAGVLAKANLTDDDLLALAETLKEVGPLELSRVLAAFERSTNALVGSALLTALKQCKSLSSLRVDLIKTVLAKYPESVQQQSQGLLALLNADAARQSAHLDELLASLKNGDIRRGQALFNSQKAACSSCHAMGYLGGNVGPDLTSIGQGRTERDLLESIVYPSASFVRSFEPFIVKTRDEEYNGVIRKDAPDELVLATGPGTEVRLARSDIVELRPSTVSIMPAGLEGQLTRQELADLVAFLKATKWGAN